MTFPYPNGGEVQAKAPDVEGRYASVHGRCRTQSDSESVYGPRAPLRSSCGEADDRQCRGDPVPGAAQGARAGADAAGDRGPPADLGGSRQSGDRTAAVPLGGNGEVA